jgi:tetratricopeptide (TPR) repeat protein
MLRTAWICAVAIGIVGPIGCKSIGTQSSDNPGDIKPALLVGPEAIGSAPPPVELPNKDAARLCIRTAQEYEKNGQTEEAIRLFEKARTADPTVAKVASRRLAVLYDSTGDFGKAATEYEVLLKANPKDAGLLNDLGYSYYCRGDWANAESTLLKAVQIDPAQKRAWINLGLSQAQLGKWDESLASFAKVVRPAEAHSNIAFVLAAQGKLDDAKAQYREALTLDPSLRLAQMALAKLDPAVAAASVPTIDELRARLKLSTASDPVVAPAGDATRTEEK